MSEYFIVTSYHYVRHATLAEAEAARDAMMARTGKPMRVLRCKTSLHGAGHFPRLVALLRDLLAQGLDDENRGRAEGLLARIATRTPHLAEDGVAAAPQESLLA